MLCHACPKSPPQPQMDMANNKKESKGVGIHIIGGRSGVWGFCACSWEMKAKWAHQLAIFSYLFGGWRELDPPKRYTGQDENKQQDENSHTWHHGKLVIPNMRKKSFSVIADKNNNGLSKEAAEFQSMKIFRRQCSKPWAPWSQGISLALSRRLDYITFRDPFLFYFMIPLDKKKWNHRTNLLPGLWTRY